MSYTPAQKIEYPWLVLHGDHVAYRAKDVESTKEGNFLIPNGEWGYINKCGTCDKLASPLAVIAGRWRVTYQMT